MKSFLISAVTFLSLLSWSMASEAVSSFNCNAQMIGLDDDGVSTRGLIAPLLVSSNKDSLINAKYTYEALSLNFNPNVLNDKGAYVILDGRAKMMLLNVHVSLKAVNDKAIRVEMTDRVSNVSAVATFKASAGEATATLSTVEGSFHLTCRAY